MYVIGNNYCINLVELHSVYHAIVLPLRHVVNVSSTSLGAAAASTTTSLYFLCQNYIRFYAAQLRFDLTGQFSDIHLLSTLLIYIPNGRLCFFFLYIRFYKFLSKSL